MDDAAMHPEAPREGSDPALDGARGGVAVHPAWWLVIIGITGFFGLHGGPLFIDDAYITFRYAENIASGRGFVYNTEPILGVTTPLFALLLAAARAAGIHVMHTAFALGLLGGVTAPLLVWRIGIVLARPRAGLSAALLLGLFPLWWYHGKTGMETTSAAALALSAVLTFYRGRLRACGIICALLVLTRPDAAVLPLLIGGAVLMRSPRRILSLVVPAGIVYAPWLVFATLTFSSPIPQSLVTKKLTHFMPWAEALHCYLAGFAEVGGGHATAVVSVFWVAGAIWICAAWRRALLLVVWPVTAIVSLAATEVMPFVWYVVPLWPVYFLVACCGFERLHAALPRAALPRAGRAALLLVPIGFLVWQIGSVAPSLLEPDRLRVLDARERLYLEMAARIRERTAELALDPADTRVFVSEVGALGYGLLEFPVHDGINSREVLESWQWDWRQLRTASDRATRMHLRETVLRRTWSTLEKLDPQFIASHTLYNGVGRLMREPRFLRRYRLLESWTLLPPGRYVVLERIP